MKIANRFYENARKPTKTIGGRIMLWLMNVGHNPMAMWGLSFVDFSGCKRVLDIGCGGGKNLANILKRARMAKVCGIDNSSEGVEVSLSFNRIAVSSGRIEVKEASVAAIPYKDEDFDVVTAFETIYFWPDIVDSFKETARVLKKGGVFMICNETQHPEGNEKWSDLLKMTIYTDEQIKSLVEQAGLSNIEIHKHKNRKWLCVIGKTTPL